MTQQLHYLVLTPLTQRYWKEGAPVSPCSQQQCPQQPNLEGAKMSFNGGVDKKDVVHMHNGILLSHRKGWIPTICMDLDGPAGDYAKWHKSSRERQWSYGFTPMWNGRNSMEDMTRKKGKRKRGNQRGRWTMRDYGLRETNGRLQKGRG